MNDTIECVITQDDIAQAETEYTLAIEATQALERFIGTYECYGAVLMLKPKFSDKADPNVTFERRIA